MSIYNNRYENINFEMREHTIYKLRVPGKNIVRYVGRTWMRPSDRLDNHIKDAIHSRELPTSRLGCWILALHAAGFEPDVDEIETVGSDMAIIHEAHWIEHHRAAGAPLLNANSGGNKPYAWALSKLTFEERAACCADPDYDLKQRS